MAIALRIYVSFKTPINRCIQWIRFPLVAFIDVLQSF